MLLSCGMGVEDQRRGCSCQKVRGDRTGSDRHSGPVSVSHESHPTGLSSLTS